ncbi:MAG TPA: exodeoxyribonuclease VII small subunit [Thermomicrobiales bacterium]|nr:exodeoxyribonuclease VII small subunit [Thermomicrobiales bacterium]
MADLLPGQDLSFEEALAQLEELVARLEEGRLPLADAVEHYERGMALAAYCGDLLDSAELRIRQVEAADAPAEANGDEYDLNEEIGRLLFDEE